MKLFRTKNWESLCIKWTAFQNSIAHKKSYTLHTHRRNKKKKYRAHLGLHWCQYLILKLVNTTFNFTPCWFCLRYAIYFPLSFDFFVRWIFFFVCLCVRCARKANDWAGGRANAMEIADGTDSESASMKWSRQCEKLSIQITKCQRGRMAHKANWNTPGYGMKNRNRPLTPLPSSSIY